jgi:hypothetical protein
MEAKQEAEHLHENWINGNRKDVMQALTDMSSIRAACITAHMVWMMASGPGGVIDDFIRMMERRLE